MLDNVYFQMIIIILIIGYGLFCLIKVGRVYLQHSKLKKEYIEKNRGKYVYQQDFYIWAIVYSLVSVIAFALAIYDVTNQKDYTMAAAFAFMGMFCVTFVMDAIMKRQAFFDEDGFFYELKYYRYRSVVRLEPRKSIIQSYDLFLSGDTSIRISRKMGDVLEEKRKEYKKNKKNK